MRPTILLNAFGKRTKKSEIMKEATLATIFTADTSREAEAIIQRLRTSGLHPAELGLTVPISFAHTERKFPIEVPVEEAETARTVLENRPPLVGV
jgi:hypothetical protein